MAIDVTVQDSTDGIDVTVSGGASTSRPNVSDSGTQVVSGPSDLNFDTNLSVTDDGDGTVTITASGGGGGGSAVEIQEDGNSLTTDVTLIDVLSGLTATEPATDEIDLAVDESEIDHDALLNFVANEHVDHSTVDITAGTLLTGGGDITASRTLNVDEGSISHDGIDQTTVSADDHHAEDQSANYKDGGSFEIDVAEFAGGLGTADTVPLSDGAAVTWSTVPNAGLVNSSVTVTAGDGLKNGGSVALGGSTTVDIEPADFAGSFLADDGTDNLQVSGDTDALDGSQGTDGQVWTSTGTGAQWEAASGGGPTEADTGTVTASGGSTPAVNTTLTNVSISQTTPHDVIVYTDADPAFSADYGYNYDFGLSWDDTNSQVDIDLTVTWDTDPGGGNDVILRWEVLDYS